MYSMYMHVQRMSECALRDFSVLPLWHRLGAFSEGEDWLMASRSVPGRGCRKSRCSVCLSKSSSFPGHLSLRGRETTRPLLRVEAGPSPFPSPPLLPPSPSDSCLPLGLEGPEGSVPNDHGPLSYPPCLSHPIWNMGIRTCITDLHLLSCCSGSQARRVFASCSPSQLVLPWGGDEEGKEGH